jgi:hypothetical protein
VEKEPEPLELNAVGKQSIEQTYAAIDQYFELLKRNFASVPTGGAEWGEKWKRWAETNIGATQEYFKRLSQAKDLDLASSHGLYAIASDCTRRTNNQFWQAFCGSFFWRGAPCRKEGQKLGL